MRRTRQISRTLAEGAVIQTAITATGIGAMVLWARYCDHHRVKSAGNHG